MVGNDVTEVVLQFFRNGELVKQFNATMISLIPKVPAPQSAHVAMFYINVSPNYYVKY